MRAATDRRQAGGAPPIRLQVKELAQLFHTLDPFPFRERDLDSGVEEYVVGWAGELPAHAPLRILVHVPQAEADREEAAHVGEAMRSYFAYRAEVVGWELRGLFRLGRTALAIGLAVLAACVLISRLARAILPGGYLAGLLEEGLVILGWVANWRPIEIFLYDWWPLAGRRRLYRRLSEAAVELHTDTTPIASPESQATR